ncbi:hypothetical protein MLD38_020691 [Melastoma candidum]|uniref:Uncharacterized protein n=1 Tax=Melastoma candidum TaxID=119954 RepID=A0ACB9QE96_9MYRT|nr:hypothetical protein MLD38_020691 [Melastoma candidum]
MELVNATWLCISGHLDLHLLSPDTRYAVYLVFKSEVTPYRLYNNTAKAKGRGFGWEYFESHIFPFMESRGRQQERKNYQMRRHRIFPGKEWRKVVVPREERMDGWMEVELGEVFSSRDYNGKVPWWGEFSIYDEYGVNPRSRIVIQGIEIRPKQDVKLF